MNYKNYFKLILFIISAIALIIAIIALTRKDNTIRGLYVQEWLRNSDGKSPYLENAMIDPHCNHLIAFGRNHINFGSAIPKSCSHTAPPNNTWQYGAYEALKLCKKIKKLKKLKAEIYVSVGGGGPGTIGWTPNNIMQFKKVLKNCHKNNWWDIVHVHGICFDLEVSGVTPNPSETTPTIKDFENLFKYTKKMKYKVMVTTGGSYQPYLFRKFPLSYYNDWINSKYIDILSPEFYGWQQWSSKLALQWIAWCSSYNMKDTKTKCIKEGQIWMDCCGAQCGNSKVNCIAHEQSNPPDPNFKFHWTKPKPKIVPSIPGYWEYDALKTKWKSIKCNNGKKCPDISGYIQWCPKKGGAGGSCVVTNT